MSFTSSAKSECRDDYFGKTEQILAYRIKEYQSLESSVYAYHTES